VRLGPDDAATLWQAASEAPSPPISPALRETLRRVKSGAPARPDRPFASMKMPKGSNAWAVAPGRSATGGALLAGDPHLEHDLPATWFEVRMHWPGGMLAGASLPGAPGVLIGHNERVAWAFTVAATDDADLFLIEVDDETAPTRFRDAGEWRPFEIERRRVAVRNEGGRELTSRRLGPAFYSGPSGIPGFGLLQRSAGREHAGLFEVVLGIDLAHSVGEAVAAARRFPGPGMNFVAADAGGSIAHAVVGPFPLRSGESWDGQLPDLWRGPGAWTGFAPSERLPLALDPPEGFVASANDEGIARRPPAPGQIPLHGDFYAPWRVGRIRQRLADLPAARPEDMVALQLDTRAGSAADLAAEIRACAIRGPAAELLLGWTGEMDGAGAPLLHEAFRAALNNRVRTRTRLGDGFAQTRLELGLLRASRGNPWIAEQWNDPQTAWTETPCDQLGRALDEAWQACRTHAGADPALWRWRSWHVLSLRSLVGVGPLGRFFNPAPIGLPGAADSVLAQAHRQPREGWKGKPFRIVHGVSYRIVVEFDKNGRVRSRSALPGGEDEHPHSRYAFDRLPDYAAGVLRPLFPADPPTSEGITLTPR